MKMGKGGPGLVVLVFGVLGVVGGLVVAARWSGARPAARNSLPVNGREGDMPARGAIVAAVPGAPEGGEGGVRKPGLREAVGRLHASPNVQRILGLDELCGDYAARAKALRALTAWSLSDDDVKALRLFLDAKASEQKDLSVIAYNGLKNDVLDVLLRQEPGPKGLGRQLVRMYRDASYDDVWRDYCLQYLPACYETVTPTGVLTNEPDVTRKEIEMTCWAALESKGTTMAGTSLIALEGLSRTHAEFERSRIAEAALSLAADDVCGEASRITALRICGMMGATNGVAVARVVAQTGETIPLRMAAVATLGDLGGRDDAELLRALSVDTEKRISAVAITAMGKLRARLEKKPVDPGGRL